MFMGTKYEQDQVLDKLFRHMFATWNESSGGGGRGGQNITTITRNNQFPIIYGELRQ